MADYALLNQMLYEGRHERVQQMVEEVLREERPPLEVLEDGLIGGMRVIAEDFKHNRIFVPEVLLAARAMKAGLAVLRPLLAAGRHEKSALSTTIVLGTVKGDLHDIGKNLVAAMLEGGGFEVVDLGVNVPPEKFVEAVRSRNAHIVAMSALLTTTMPSMRTTIEAFKQAGLRDQVRIFIGGAPITQKYADEIGTDGYSESAPGTVTLAHQAMGARR